MKCCSALQIIHHTIQNILYLTYCFDGTTLFPGSSLLKKDPGNSWSRGSQILGAKLKLFLGRGGKGVHLLCFENYNLCVIVSGNKI
jgi:hypothetical protein